MITATDLTRTFGDITAVDSLSFTVNRGEIFGIVGPDGSGKSTLLRMLSSILVPDGGTITINGINVKENPFKIKESLAYMPQRFGLYEDLTVEENIFFFGRLFLLSRREIRKKLDSLYGFSRLGPYKDRLAGKLSGGMKQKLGLVCSLVHTPEVLLLDEPTNGVDPVSRREFWDILYELLGQGVTIMVTTAYLDEAERSNRVALMYRGKFIRLGKPKSIREELRQRMLHIIVDDPHRAETALKVDGGMKIVRTGNSIRIFTGTLEKTKKQAEQLLKRKGVGILKAEEVMPRLEDSFIEIITREEDR
ncbi:MAG TPA: ABC transporter ATP-binding protein [Spirochaetota bacterium]|nr:ABC transporter ATP-binding protein [Spirochaetota bacterium]HPC39553.1 ABC transporter ATP-binding protein [Spirochaetota bacterium]HPL15272.1 ABC transporter ATP-binding protein [Spirochaetota bacterium]HQF06890.1 ABC transporter ATP-binding protein [Spirochaetota bacterium]HQH95491.1 ABC transporter ATP-binding protein [Spirochaetota bacterium]